MKKEKLIYIYPKKSTFIVDDISFLKKEYTVQTQDLQWNSPLRLPLNFLLQFFFLVKEISTTKAIIISFAGYFSLLPTFFGKLFKKPVFIILNGAECVSFPSYNYGSLRKKVLKYFIKKSLENGSKLLPVDASLILQEHTFDATVKNKKQGFQHYFPNLKTPFKVIPNGFDLDFWKIERSEKKGFITVAFVNNMSTFKYKGLDLHIGIAAEFPQENFTIIGVSDVVKSQLPFIPRNVTIISSMKRDDLKANYAKHQFYLQLSINEGFGCNLAEAMLCKCIPIVSQTGVLKNVIGDSGFLIEKKNMDDALEIVSQAIYLTQQEKNYLQLKARKRIVTTFDISTRENLILQEIES